MNTANALAAIVNLFIPGVGQLIQGRIIAGLFFLLAVPFGYLLFVIPGIIMHIWCVVNAANYKD